MGQSMKHLFLVPFALSAATVFPTPQSVQQGDGPVLFLKGQAIIIVSGEPASATVKAAVAMIARELHGWRVELMDKAPAAGPAIILHNVSVQGKLSARDKEPVLDAGRHFGQGY